MPHAHVQPRQDESPAATVRAIATPANAGTRPGFGDRAPANPWRAAASLGWLAGLALVVGLTGCGGSTPPTPTATTPAATARASTAVATAAAPPPPPTSAIPTQFAGLGSPAAGPAGEIGPVVWARSVDPATKAPIDRTTTFPPDAPAIYAVVPVVRLAPNARLTASWSYNDTSLDTFTQTVTADGHTGPRWVEFHIARSSATPWPAGDYTVVVRLANGGAQTASMTIAEAS